MAKVYGIGFPFHNHSAVYIEDGKIKYAVEDDKMMRTKTPFIWGWLQWQPFLLYGEDVWPGTNSKGGPLKTDRIHFSGGEAKIAHADGGGHTCPKPLAFMEKLLGRFTLQGETILDPFMGSGTTLVACAKLGRKGIGIELDPDYFEIAVKRVRDAYAQPDLFIAPPEKPVQEVLI